MGDEPATLLTPPPQDLGARVLLGLNTARGPIDPTQLFHVRHPKPWGSTGPVVVCRYGIIECTRAHR